MTWNHRICEVCWFVREPDRFPVQIKREPADRMVDVCCFCGSLKVTRIFVREHPDSPDLRACFGSLGHDDE